MRSEPPSAERDVLAAVENAVALHRWDEALARLDADPASAGGATGLELRAKAAYGAGDPEGSIGAWEALYGLHLGAGVSQIRCIRPDRQRVWQ